MASSVDFVKELKSQINIADVVGEYVRLRKAGSNHMGLCPFHAERSPSFSVAEKKGIYYCFGCQRGGDVVSFMQEIQGISFREAIKLLANKFSIKLPPEFSGSGHGKEGEGPNKEQAQEVYFKLTRFVAQFFHEKLLSSSGASAKEYLRNRGVSDATVKSAYLGFAPDAWGDLHDFLASKKAPIDKAEELGLLKRKDKSMDSRQHYDLFRNRLMFPIADIRGRIIAFGGRALGETEGPKYLNSPESAIYKKGDHLYGLFTALKDVRAEGKCILVEGFMDCVALQQAGFGYTVATLGTALTPKQIGLLKRFAQDVYVLFDGDSAGQEAQNRAMELFLEQGVVVRGISLPEGLDPDEFVLQRGKDALQHLIDKAPYLLDQRILALVSEAGPHTHLRAQAVDRIATWIAKLSSPAARFYRIQEVANLLHLGSAESEGRERFEQMVEKMASQNGMQTPSQKQGFDQRNPQRFQTQRPRDFAQKGQYSLASQQSPRYGQPYFFEAAKQKLNHSKGATSRVSESFLDTLDAAFLESFVIRPQWIEQLENLQRVLDGIESQELKQLLTETKTRLGQLPNAKVSDTLFEVIEDTENLKVIREAVFRVVVKTSETVNTPEQEQETLSAFRDLEQRLVRRGVEHRREVLRTSILKADSSGQDADVSRLLAEYHELAQQLLKTQER